MKGKDRPKRIGELLAQRGVLTPIQIDDVLDEQRRSGRPFGDLAERMFGVDPAAVERAWLEQYITLDTVIDLTTQRIDEAAVAVLDRRQAWQFRVLPLRFDAGELVVATTPNRLRKAVNFAWRTLGDPVYFVIADHRQLEEQLMVHYPWPSALKLAV
jgi:hypothetical protein